jgi:hypothetical protein
VTFQELVDKSMGSKITRADLHISRGSDGELFVTSRQDGMIRMLVPYLPPKGGSHVQLSTLCFRLHGSS